MVRPEFGLREGIENMYDLDGASVSLVPLNIEHKRDTNKEYFYSQR